MSTSHKIVPQPHSPRSHLTSHARLRGAETALFDLQGESVTVRTWHQVALNVERAAAGFLHAGFKPRQVAIVLMQPGADAVEVELALRTTGVVPLYVSPDVTPAELAACLVGVDVRIVVADDEDDLERLQGCNGFGAERLLMHDTGDWEQLQDIGADHLREIPHCVAHADEIADPVKAAPMVVLREGSDVAVRRMPGARIDSPVETVLLHGAGWDPRVAAVRETQLVSGGPLAWTGASSHLPALLARVSPTRLVNFAATPGAVGALLLDAHVDGRPWHRSPSDVLAACLAAASGTRLSPSARRRTQAIHGLAPWFGPALSTVVLDAHRDPVLNAVARALSLQVLESALPTLEPGTLPRPPAPRRVSSAPLPRRSSSQPDNAFVGVAERVTSR